MSDSTGWVKAAKALMTMGRCRGCTAAPSPHQVRPRVARIPRPTTGPRQRYQPLWSMDGQSVPAWGSAVLSARVRRPGLGLSCDTAHPSECAQRGAAQSNGDAAVAAAIAPHAHAAPRRRCTYDACLSIIISNSTSKTLVQQLEVSDRVHTAPALVQSPSCSLVVALMTTHRH